MPAAPCSSPLPRFYGSHDTVFEVALHEPAAHPVPEALLHALWQRQQFDPRRLRTTEGAPVQVLTAGMLNADAGPDFRDARLRIGDILWHGDVEIHRTSSQWFHHGHHRDARYNGVVLHVVLAPDLWTGGLLREDGRLLPEVVLADALQTPLRTLLHHFYTQAETTLPCAHGWPRVPATVRDAWIDRLARERLYEKKQRLAAQYLEQPDLEALLHLHLWSGLGYAKNAAPMRELAHRIPLSLARTLPDLQDLEALHFGVAGLLPEPDALLKADRATADYVIDLRARFARLQHAHQLPALPPTAWRFFRLRPANFPTRRLAQAAALLQPEALLHRDPVGILLAALDETDSLKTFRRLLAPPLHPFWQTHVRLEKAARPLSPRLGQQRADALLANAVLPLLLLYAEQHHDPILETRVFGLMHRMPAAQDEITRRFEAVGLTPRDAYTAQGLHHLYRTYCAASRCLECSIGRNLLNR